MDKSHHQNSNSNDGEVSGINSNGHFQSFDLKLGSGASSSGGGISSGGKNFNPKFGLGANTSGSSSGGMSFDLKFGLGASTSGGSGGLPVRTLPGALDRVTSDALPHSTLPCMVICGSGGSSDSTDPKLALQRTLADARSFQSCSTEDIDELPLDSPRQLASPAPAEMVPAEQDEFTDTGNDSLGDIDMPILLESGGTADVEERERQPVVLSHKQQAKGRPQSAPNRYTSSSSSSAATKNSSRQGGAMTTSPHKKTTPTSTAAEWLAMKEKRQSLDIERQNRMASIMESTQAAMKYSASRKSESLPREVRSSSLSHALMSTGQPTNDGSSNGTGTKFRKTSSPIIQAVTTAVSSTAAGTADSRESITVVSPLNLRHLSIDDTKQASLTQMDEIWKEVEEASTDNNKRNSIAISQNGSVFSDSLYPAPPPSAGEDKEEDLETSLDIANGVRMTTVTDESPTGERPRGETVAAAITNSSNDNKPAGGLKESDISISLLEPPMGQSTPLGADKEGVARGNGRTKMSLLQPSSAENRKLSRPLSFSNKGMCVM